MLALLVIAAMLINSPMILLAAQQDELQPYAYQHAIEGSMDIESFSTTPTILHWQATPNPVIIPIGQDYIDLTFRLEWAETPQVPLRVATARLDLPYRSLTPIDNTALLEPGIPGQIRVSGGVHLSPGLLSPDGVSMFPIEIGGLAPVQDLTGWAGEVAFSVRLAINPGHLQNPGDIMSIGVTRTPFGGAFGVTTTHVLVIRGSL